MLAIAEMYVQGVSTRDSLLRLATGVLVEIDEDWETSDRIYINWDNPDA